MLHIVMMMEKFLFFRIRLKPDAKPQTQRPAKNAFHYCVKLDTSRNDLQETE